MYNETGILEFMELQIPGIPMIMMVILIQPTMGIKWNSGSLLDIEAHIPSETQNNPKKNKRKQLRKEEYP